eukprot:TRINITY_DN4653_c0_g1_i3.p1 TRINITY_DN4653_c0_g1~~TRINITY_DN4653_c0_g1_i3.p1  ORF type:complete len:143 (+),score=25.58 TRINITY_DN4653_c0_g1_i3:72-500(+)
MSSFNNSNIGQTHAELDNYYFDLSIQNSSYFEGMCSQELFNYGNPIKYNRLIYENQLIEEDNPGNSEAAIHQMVGQDINSLQLNQQQLQQNQIQQQQQQQVRSESKNDARSNILKILNCHLPKSINDSMRDELVDNLKKFFK